MITCRELIDFLAEYLDHELPDAELTEFERHLAGCPCCVHYLETYKKTVRLGKQVCKGEEAECADMPEDLIKAVMAARNAGKPEAKP